jgi:large subunit ribosomal protein L20
MARVKRGYKARRRRKAIMKAARGFYGGRSRIYRIAIQAVHRAWQNQYRHRRLRKRDFRALWIVRINAAARERGMSYSKFMGALKKANVTLDRKALAYLAFKEPAAFDAVAEVAKQHLPS